MTYKIIPMKADDVPQALAVWRSQFYKYCKNDSFPNFGVGGTETIKRYLLRQIDLNNALVAMKDDTIVGYMAWIYFDFHKERTAFLPTIGSAADSNDENAIYYSLYVKASQYWVRDNRFNHLWMTFYDNIHLKDMLYDIGFASYVIDACQRTSPNIVTAKENYTITELDESNVDEAFLLANDSERYLQEPPVFLLREQWKREEIVSLINNLQTFAAWDRDRIVGLISFEINQNYHFERLTDVDSSYIGGIGAYVMPEYRGKGIGAQLLHSAFDFCHKAGKPFLHVSFESANQNAIRFWPKYFKPAIRSLRRTVNKDANSTH